MSTLTRPADQPTASPSPPLIKLRGFTKLYQMGDSTVRALDGVDLDIGEGEFVSITGASGSGKSTMMHLLGCLDRPTDGEYELLGQRVSQMRDAQLARVRNESIGFVFQTFNLINRTSAADNVAVPLVYGRTGERGSPPWPLWSASAWPTVLRTNPANCPAENASASPSPAPSSINPKSSSPTNPPETSTPKPARPSWPSSTNSTEAA